MSNYVQTSYNKERKDKFQLVIPLPIGIKGISTSASLPSAPSNSGLKFDSLILSVYGAIVPEMKVPTITIPYAGQNYNVSSLVRPPYSELTVNFTIDNRFNNYWVISSWLNLLNDQKQSIFDANNITNSININEKSSKQYMTDMSLFALDEYEKRVIEFKYTKAFPTGLGGINFNYRDPGEIETTVTFAYSQLQTLLVEQVDTL